LQSMLQVDPLGLASRWNRGGALAVVAGSGSGGEGWSMGGRDGRGRD